MDRHALERLGHHVVSRRVALRYRNRTDLAKSLPFTVRTLADIEQGVRKASAGTYAMLENTLAWAPGSIDTTGRGANPKRRWSNCAGQPPRRYPTLPADVLSRGLHRGVAAGVTTAHHRPPHQTPRVLGRRGALDPHGDWPEQGLAAST